ncbi:MAG TPA: hypothetical protein DDZ41_11735, partial [Flavobacterium sp.]|nr:hypothetical protein [Flavobacterium sp.]
MLLAFLRFISYSLVFLLLINPIISTKTFEIVKTPLPVFFDNSQSITLLNADANTKEIHDFLVNNKSLNEKFSLQE